MNETANNGPAKSTLSERVRSLSLSSSSDAAPSEGNRWWWIPWALCGVFFCVAGLFAMEALAPIDDDMIKKLAEERGLNKGTAAPTTSLAGLGVKSLPSDSAALEISLESKGNIIPAS